MKGKFVRFRDLLDLGLIGEKDLIALRDERKAAVEPKPTEGIIPTKKGKKGGKQ
jgi:hypothetical protein